MDVDFMLALPSKPPWAGACAIYVLVDPRQPSVVRYVGKTVNPSSRLSSHRNTSRTRNVYFAAWVNSLQREDVDPLMRVVAWVAAHDWEEWEKRTILQARCLFGDKLTNRSIGGDGSSTLARIQQKLAVTGKRQSKEHVEKRVAHRRGVSRSAEDREKIRLGMQKARDNRPDGINPNRRDSHLGYKHSDKARRLMSAAHTGVPQSREHVQKRVQAGLATRRKKKEAKNVVLCS